MEPYLQFVLDGKKTVESRFSVHRVAPYRQVAANDVILLKRAGGPIVGISQVTSAWFYKLGPGSFQEIAAQFGKAICPVGDDFWIDRQSAEYATLIRLGQVQRTEPVAFPKRDRRAWVVLKHSEPQHDLFTQPLVLALVGPIASGKTTIGVALANSLGVPFGSFGKIIRMIARSKGLPESRATLQRLGQELVNRDPTHLCSDVLTAAGWRPGMSAVIEGLRHPSVLAALRRLTKPVPVRVVYVDVDLDTTFSRTSLSARTIAQYRADPTEREVPDLRATADFCVSGVSPVDQTVTEIRKAFGLYHGE